MLTAPAVANETLVVYAASDRGEFDAGRGFLHGADEQTTVPPDSARTAVLRPTDWRLFKLPTLIEAHRHGATVTFGISNPYAWWKGGWEYAKPWLDYEEWESYVAGYVQALLNYYPQYPPEYWDIWNEPDHPYFWRGTYAQFLETFARGADAIRSVIPEAKIVGPSISWLRQNGTGVQNVIDFLRDLDYQYDLRVDAVSWHENGGAFHGGPLPAQVLDDTQWIRAQLAAHFPPSYQPELHINEYLGAQEHLSPAWNVGYLYYLGEAELDASMRACWNVYSDDQLGDFEYWSDCWAGLNGMFMQDNSTPQPAYWVNKAHADMAGGRWLTTSSTASTTNVIAVRRDETQTMQLLVGRHYDFAVADVSIHVLDYPYAGAGDSVRVRVDRIPHFPQFYTSPPKAIPWPDGPIPHGVSTIALTGHSFQFDIEGFAEGDAYTIEIEPVIATTGIASDDPAPQRPSFLRVLPARPNPFATRTSIPFRLEEGAEVELAIYDALGRRVRMLRPGWHTPGRHAADWDGLDERGARVASGVYLVRLCAGSDEAGTTVRVVR